VNTFEAPEGETPKASMGREWERVSPQQPTSGSGERRELPSGVRVKAPTENGKRVSVLFKRQRMFLVEMFVVN